MTDNNFFGVNKLHYLIGIIKNNGNLDGCITSKNCHGIDLSLWKVAYEFCGYTAEIKQYNHYVHAGIDSRVEMRLGLFITD